MHYWPSIAIYRAVSPRPLNLPAAGRRELSIQECQDRLQVLGFQSLREYRDSDLWRQAKARYQSSDYPQRCLVCGAPGFELHHRSYERLGKEELFDLVPLCRGHHQKLHDLLDLNPEHCVKDTHDYLVLLLDKPETALSLTLPTPGGPESHHPDKLVCHRCGIWAPRSQMKVLTDSAVLTNLCPNCTGKTS
jgi:hypothetical protein